MRKTNIISINLDEMTTFQVNTFKTMLEREIKEIAGTIRNHHIWALGSSSPEDAEMHERTADEGRGALKLLKGILDACSEDPVAGPEDLITAEGHPDNLVPEEGNQEKRPLFPSEAETHIIADNAEKNTIYTRDEAMLIIEMFEDILCASNIKVPSPEDNDRGADNDAALYGSTYYALLDDVEANLVELLERHKPDTEIVQDELSGTA